MTTQAVNFWNYIPTAERAGIVAQTSTYPCDGALASAEAAVPAAGGKIEIGGGKFRFANTYNLHKQVILDGVASGAAGTMATLFSFPAGKLGIIVNRHITHGDGLQASSGGADGSVIRNIDFISDGPTGAPAHAIWMRARAEVNNVAGYNFSGDVVHIHAQGDSPDPSLVGNANGWMAFRVRGNACRNVLFVMGADANAGVAIGIDGANCRERCIFEYSFLGNTYIGCHAEANALRPYESKGISAANMFINCYSEPGQPPSLFVAPTMVLGGMHGAGIVGDAMVAIGGVFSQVTGRQYIQKSPDDGTRRFIDTRIAAPGSFIEFVPEGEDAAGWALDWNEIEKIIGLRHEHRDWEMPFALTTKMTLGTKYVGEDGLPLGGGKMVMDGVYARADSGRYRPISFNDLEKRIKALESKP